MTKKQTKTIKKTTPEPEIDLELQAIAQELNALMQEKGVALQPFIRTITDKLGLKTGEIAAVELVRFNKPDEQ